MLMWVSDGLLLAADDGQSDDRMCAITGHPEKVQNAISMIHDLLSNANSGEVSLCAVQTDVGFLHKYPKSCTHSRSWP